jgi:hypothetical protein
MGSSPFQKDIQTCSNRILISIFLLITKHPPAMTGMSFSVFLAASLAAAMAGPFWLMVGEGGDQRLQNAVLLSPSYCICES